MAYTPKTWVCGEVINADSLNNMEEGIQEALQSGYECTETETVFFNGSITTQDAGVGFAFGAFTPTQAISGDTLTVTMNGTEYELPKIDLGGQEAYGEFSGSAPVFTTYPCLVVSAGQFATQNPGTYTVKMSSLVKTTTTTDCFKSAVKSVVKTLEHILDGKADGSLRSNTSTPEGTGYALGDSAVALGEITKANGKASFAEGEGSEARGDSSHAEGGGTIAEGDGAHSEGSGTRAIGEASHAEGINGIASAEAAHAEGIWARASGRTSHAEGDQTYALGEASHSEGSDTHASGKASHAEGSGAYADGEASHAQNENTIAQGRSQTAIGKFNVAQGNATTANATDYAFIIGNGASSSARSNAVAIKWDGTFVFANGTEITPAQFASLLALL